MISKAWVASHTGLPSFYLTGAAQLVADGGRIVADTDTQTLVSDPLAPVGQPVTYQQGASIVTLTRTAPAGTVNALITDPLGRGPRVGWVNNGDPTSTRLDKTIYGNGLTRYALNPAQVEGSAQILLPDLGTQKRLEELLCAHSSLILVNLERGVNVPPIRGIEVLDWSRRTYGSRRLLYDVKYVETREPRITGGPVVTWGEWSKWGEANSPSGWQEWSALEVASHVAGMPG